MDVLTSAYRGSALQPVLASTFSIGDFSTNASWAYFESMTGGLHLLEAILDAGLLQHHMSSGSGPGGAAVVFCRVLLRGRLPLPSLLCLRLCAL